MCSGTYTSYRSFRVEKELGKIRIIDQTGRDGVKNCKTLHIKLIEDVNEWWWDNYDIEQTRHRRSEETGKVVTAAQAAFGGERS